MMKGIKFMSLLGVAIMLSENVCGIPVDVQDAAALAAAEAQEVVMSGGGIGESGSPMDAVQPDTVMNLASAVRMKRSISNPMSLVYSKSTYQNGKVFESEQKFRAKRDVDTGTAVDENSTDDSSSSSEYSSSESEES